MASIMASLRVELMIKDLMIGLWWVVLCKFEVKFGIGFSFGCS